MNVFKRFFALLLTLSMVFSLVPMSVFAEQSGNDGIMTTALELGTKPANGTSNGEPFPQGTGGSNSFRIPALVTLKDGTLLAAADARWNTTYDGGGLDTIVATSADGSGSTWNYSFANYLGDNGNQYNGSGSSCFIDPSLAVDKNGTIYMLVDLYPYGVALNGEGFTAPSTQTGFNAAGKLLLSDNNHTSYDYYLDGTVIKSTDGTAVADYTVDAHFNLYQDGSYVTNLFFSDSPYKVQRTGYLYLTTSTNGQDWSAPQLLNLKTSSEMVCLVSPGRGLVTSNGMIVFPVYSYGGSEASQKTGFIYSSDGVNWNRSSNFTGATWSSESAVVQLPNGNLRFFYRNGTAKLCYADYNLTTNSWGAANNTNIATNSNTQISAINYSKTVDGKQVILVSCPTGNGGNGSTSSQASERLNGKIFIFTVDDGGSMTKAGEIAVNSNNAQFMYSCLTEMNNGSVAILYEDRQNAWGTGDSCYYTMDFETYSVANLETAMNDQFDGPNGATTDIANTVNVELTVGQTSQVYTDNTGNYEKTATIQDNTVATMNISGEDAVTGEKTLVEVTELVSLDPNKQYVIVSNRAGTEGGQYTDLAHSVLTNESYTSGDADWLGTMTGLHMTGPADVDCEELWVIAPSGNGYTIMQDGQYLHIGLKSASMSADAMVFELEYTANGWRIKNGNNYLSEMAATTLEGAFGWNEPNDAGNFWTIYEVSDPADPASTRVSFTGAKVGTTTAVVGQTRYNITVVPVPEVVEIELNAGQESTFTIEGYGYTSTDVKVQPNGNVATLKTVTPVSNMIAGNLEAVTTSEIPNGQYLLVNNRAGGMLTTGSAVDGNDVGLAVGGTAAFNSTELWTITKTTNGYTVSRNGQYLYVNNRDAGLTANASDLTLEQINGNWVIHNGNIYLSDLYGDYWNGVTGYDDAGDAGNYWTIYRIVPTDTENSTEVTFTGVEAGTTTATVGHVTYKITVYNQVKITVNYQANGQTVAVDTSILVGANATEYTLPIVIYDDEGNAYTVDNTMLALTPGTSTYNVPVTLVDGESKQVEVGKSETVSVDGELQDGQYIVWTTSDPSRVSVAPEYTKDGQLTLDGIMIGNAQTADDPVVVIATVYNADGSVAAVKKWVVTVTGTNTNLNNTSKYIYIDIVKIQNCTVYYSINGGQLVEITDDMLELDPSGHFYKLKVPLMDEQYTSGFQITFFAAPDDGYALVYMSSTNSAGEYYTLSDGNPDGVGSQAWPFVDGYNYDNFDGLSTKPSGSDSSVFKTKQDEQVGIRWGLIQGNLSVDQMKVMYANAIALGCDGTLVFTKNNNGTANGSRENYGGNDLVSELVFIATPLPEIEKTLNGVLPTTRLMEYFRRYNGSELVAAVDEYVYFNVTITLGAPAIMEVGTSRTNALEFVEHAIVTDNLEGAYFYTKALDEADNNYPNCGTPGVLMDGVIDYAPNRLTEQDILDVLNAEWTDEEIAAGERVIELFVVYPIQAGDIDTTITNTVNFDFSYSSRYSKGTIDEEAEAAADIRVVGRYMDDIVVDFGLPVVITDTDNAYGFTTAARAECQYGTATLNGNTLTYKPSSVLQGNDHVVLYDAQGKSVNSFFVIPATTVYYEEGFATYTGSWISTGSTGTGTQELQFVGAAGNNFGYDGTYAAETDMSNGTDAVSSTAGSKATFTFTGTGVDIYANCDTDTGIVAVVLYEVNGDTQTVKKVYQVATATKAGTTDATANQGGAANSLPIVAISNLPHGTYKVEILVTGVQGAFHFDGFRVYHTTTNQSSYPANEQNAMFIELRDEALFAANVTSTTTPGQVYTASSGLTGVSLLYLTDDTASDLLENGPKNEIWLSGASTLSFYLPIDAQIGLKAPCGAVTVVISRPGEADITYTITSATDMFYDIPGGTDAVTIQVSGNGIVSITKLKAITGGTDIEPLGEIDEEVVTFALNRMFNVEPVVETFADVSNDTFYYDSVMWAVENGITTGTTATTFAPLANCNRAQVVTFLWRAAGSPEPNSIKSPFVDVDADAYYYKAVLWAVENGITNGVDTTHFAPDAVCNRGQVVTFLWRAEGCPEPTSSKNPFADVSADAFYYEAVLWAVENDITNGVDATHFAFENECNRAQVVTFLYRAMA